MSTNRRALLLARDDKEIQGIFHRASKRIEATNDLLAVLRERQWRAIKRHREQETSDLEDIKLRIEAMGIRVMNKDKHQITINLDEGVVWLESNEGCQCPVCTLAGRAGIVIVGEDPR